MMTKSYQQTRMIKKMTNDLTLRQNKALPMRMVKKDRYKKSHKARLEIRKKTMLNKE